MKFSERLKEACSVVVPPLHALVSHRLLSTFLSFAVVQRLPLVDRYTDAALRAYASSTLASRHWRPSGEVR